MKQRRWRGDALDDLLAELGEDALDLTDEELRDELAEDGTPLDELSAGFGGTLAMAQNLPGLFPRATDAIAISSQPIEPADAHGAGGVAEPSSPYGETKWRGRSVRRLTGQVGALLELLPEFEMTPFRTRPGMAAHPELWCVVRRPGNGVSAMAVGTVSRSYALVQHREAVEMCLNGLARCGLPPEELHAELSLSALGEWMHFSFVLPAEYSFEDTYGNRIEFRCGVSNSVDGSTRLSVRFDWFRQICWNGMVIAEQRRESRLHRRGLRLDAIGELVFEEFERANRTQKNFTQWQNTPANVWTLMDWTDGPLRKAWNTHAAARVLRICATGQDTRFRIGSSGSPSHLATHGKEVENVRHAVPGSPHRAETLYDIAQAMSWVASRRTNIVERVRWQTQIPELLHQISGA